LFCLGGPVHKLRHRYGRQDAQNDHHDHQFHQGETLLSAQDPPEQFHFYASPLKTFSFLHHPPAGEMAGNEKSMSTLNQSFKLSLSPTSRFQCNDAAVFPRPQSAVFRRGK